MHGASRVIVALFLTGASVVSRERKRPARQAVSKLEKEKSGGIDPAAFFFFFALSGFYKTELPVISS